MIYIFSLHLVGCIIFSIQLPFRQRSRCWRSM